VRADRHRAFEALCRAEYAQVARTAYLITGDREEARDLAQEAFARAYERWGSVSKLERPGAWVQRVVANLAISHQRRERIRARAARPIGRVVADQREPIDPALMDGLRALPPAQRAAVVLRYFADQSVHETAKALGKREGTVRALTSQGLHALRRRLEDTERNEHDETTRR
jgi:RNA polymerase sigma-70 factor (ECF subfamily)